MILRTLTVACTALFVVAAPAGAASVNQGPISLLYVLAARSPQGFFDITAGSNALFGGPCCTASPGYDLATGLGSPIASTIAGVLPGGG